MPQFIFTFTVNPDTKEVAFAGNISPAQALGELAKVVVAHADAIAKEAIATADAKAKAAEEARAE